MNIVSTEYLAYKYNLTGNKPRFRKYLGVDVA